MSNFDTRLREILDGLQLSNLFDAIIVSAGALAEQNTCRTLFMAAAVLTMHRRRADLAGATCRGRC